MVSKRRKQLVGVGIATLIVVGAAGFFARDAFAYTYYGGVTATAIGTGAMTGNDPSPINAQESYDLTANGTKLWEINKYPVNTTADITTNKGYLFVSQSQLPANSVDGQHTSFSGGWGNPGFVEHVLLNGVQHMWDLNQSNGSNFPDGNSNYIAFSDVNDMNGMYDTTPFNVVVNGQTQAFYEPQTAINLGNKPLPHITTPLLYTAPSGGSQVSSIALGNSYWLSPSMFTAYGSNGGGLYSQNYFAAYWVPVVNGQPDTSAATYAFAENDNGTKTVYDWPGPGTIISNGGLDSASANPYGSGFMNDFELTSNTAAPSPGQLEVFLPSSFPSGTTSADLVAYYGDGVQRYDAQIASFSLQSSAPAPTLSLSETPTTSQTVGKSFAVTANTTNAQGGTVTFTQSGSLVNNSGTGTLSGDYQSNVPTISYPAQTNASYQYSPTATSSQAGSETITATLTMPNGTILTKQVSTDWTSTQPTLNLAASATTVGVGQTVTLTGTASTLQTGKGIFVHDMSNDDTINGTNVGGGAININPESVSATDGTAQTVTYEAAMDYVNPTTGQTTVIHSNKVQVTYTNKPTITLIITDTSGKQLQVTSTTGTATIYAPVPVGTTVDVVATATNMPSTDFIAISEPASGHVDAQGQPGQTTVSTPQVRNAPQTVGFQASIVAP